MSRPLAVLMLLSTTLMWGVAFIAQKSGMATMGPLTFAGVRYGLAFIVILPLAIWEWRRKVRTTGSGMTAREWRLTIVLGGVFFLGSWLQQAGLATTTATNGGFLTSLYVLFVPLIALVFLRTQPHVIVWICVPLALAGIYLLNGGIGAFNSGDALIIGCAFFWAIHVLMLSDLARSTALPIFVSTVTFGMAALLAGAGALVTEAPRLAAILPGWMQIAYAGVLSTAVAFTFQAVAQRYVPPANAAIILSSESLFAAIAGALLLGERLPPIGYFGAVLIFVAIVLVEAVPAFRPAPAGAGPSP